jgi:hypothetical protein
MSKQGSIELFFDPNNEIAGDFYRRWGRTIADVVYTHGPVCTLGADLDVWIEKAVCESFDAVWPGIVANGSGADDDEYLPKRVAVAVKAACAARLQELATWAHVGTGRA